MQEIHRTHRRPRVRLAAGERRPALHALVSVVGPHGERRTKRVSGISLRPHPDHGWSRPTTEITLGRGEFFGFADDGITPRFDATGKLYNVEP